MKKLVLAAALGLALPMVAPATAQACPCSKNKVARQQDPSPVCGDKAKDTTAKKDSKKKAKKSDKKS